MKLTKTEYVISRETLDKVLTALGNNWFSDDREYNNDEVIEAQEELEMEIMMGEK